MRNKLKNQKRSPLKKETLRHAGQSLNLKIDDAIDSEVLYSFIVMAFLFMLMICEWMRVWFNIGNHPWFYTFGFIIVSVFFGIKIIRGVKKIRDMQLGRDGECIVAEHLDELRVMGYKVFNDIVGDSFNIDHVVVGPAGVFTIETKTYRKRGNSQISYDGVKIDIDGVPPLKDPIKQAKGQMYWLEGFIKNNANLSIKVKPVVVFPGWFINQKDNNAEVWVLNEKAITGFLKNAERTLDDNQINLIASHVENYVRSN